MHPSEIKSSEMEINLCFLLPVLLFHLSENSYRALSHKAQGLVHLRRKSWPLCRSQTKPTKPHHLMCPESCWKAVGGALPSPMACRDPQGSSKASSIPSLALWLCPLWSALLVLQESTGRSVLLFSSSASTFCTWSQSRVAGAPQMRFLLTDLPLTMPTFLCIVSSSDETFPPSLLESWPTFILPAEREQYNVFPPLKSNSLCTV